MAPVKRSRRLRIDPCQSRKLKFNLNFDLPIVKGLMNNFYIYQRFLSPGDVQADVLKERFEQNDTGQSGSLKKIIKNGKSEYFDFRAL